MSRQPSHTLKVITEDALLTAVLELAARLGWLCYHARPAETGKGWRTAAQGNGAKGFPDCVLAHPKQRRLLFVELKAKGGRLSPAQVDWLDTLTDTACCEPYCWNVDDWTDGTVEMTLRAGPDG
ncbi:MAG: VRR-NUC domain-containing protein [Gemmatimonadaceae bacterium]|nr:VRR-NUC domain-containing protein [Gemmatimonadaceae bacterium]